MADTAQANVEAQLANLPADEPGARPAEDLLHQLQVHQAELEMQNEALRQTQIALAESRDRYADLYEFAPVGYLTLSSDGLIAEINLTGATLLGRERNKLLQRRFTSLVIAEDRDRWIRHLLSLQQDDEQGIVELVLQRGDGTVFQAKLHCARARGEAALGDGGAVRVRIALSDITEQHQSRLAISEARDRLAAVIDASIDAIISVDEEQRIVVFSSAAQRLFGITAAEAIGQTVDRFIPARFRSGHRARVHEYARQGSSVRKMGQFGPLSALRQDGTEFPIEASISHTVSGGRDILTVTVRDITERERTEAARVSLEAQLRESQKMEAVGTLAGGIAHDFNNIIATILGNTELARQDAVNNPSVLESMEEIRKAGTRARDLVQQILSFSRRQPTQKKNIALMPVIEESAHLLRATLPARISVDVLCAPDVPPGLVDTTQIQQIVMNLATNAAHAIQGNGRIEIRLDTVMLDAALADAHLRLRALHDRRPGRTVRLAVSDTGSGMNAATRERVFEPFFTTKPVGEGTGLGLSVVHGIVQTHEGAITVDSTPGKGTTFTIYLPVAAAAADAAASADGAPLTAPALNLGDGKRILYVDDDEALVFLVTRLLGRRGFRVSGYSTPSEALAALRADPVAFDLVVSDYNMPGMSGLDVAREVRSIRANLPVAVVSGYVDEELQTRATAAGVREIIYKTTRVNEYCGIVQRLAQTASEKAKPA